MRTLKLNVFESSWIASCFDGLNQSHSILSCIFSKLGFYGLPIIMDTFTDDFLYLFKTGHFNIFTNNVGQLLRWYLVISDGLFQNSLQPWWTVHNNFHSVATEVTSNLLSIVGSNAPKPTPIYATLRLAFHPKGALSARKCIAHKIIHCQFCFLIRAWVAIVNIRQERLKRVDLWI